MESLRLAYSENAYRVYKPNTKRHIVKTTETDFLDVAAVVITEEDKDVLKNEAVRAFSIPIIVLLTYQNRLRGCMTARLKKRLVSMKII